MKLLKPFVGKKTSAYSEKVTQERISLFCQALGNSNSHVAPPTFMTVFRKGEFDMFQELGIELSNILHADQEYQYFHEICAGDQVQFHTVLSQVLEKPNTKNPLQFVTLETDVQIEMASGLVPAGKSKTTIVIRNKVQA